jgi:hypothetical protein
MACSIAFFCAVEPSPVRVPDGQELLADGVELVSAFVVVELLLGLLPQAASAMAATAVTPAARANRVRITDEALREVEQNVLSLAR